MPLSTKPTGGPSLPAGVKRVNTVDIDTTSGAQKEDVTDLDSTKVEYADSPLKEGSAGKVSQTCSASGQAKGTLPACTPVPQNGAAETGWICTSTEEVYEAGKYAQWSASWEYIAPSTP
jgi:hypothetical protein